MLRGEQVVVIVPTRRAPDGSRVLALPKGHVDPGENALQAAEREVREETGVVVELVRELGEVRYWYRRDGRTIPKSVSFYLFNYLSGDTADHDDEVEEARWIDLRGGPDGAHPRGRARNGRRARSPICEKTDSLPACRSSTSTRRSSPTS